MIDLRMELIQGQLRDIEENVRSIKATWGNTIMTLDNIKTSLKADRQKAIDEAYQKGVHDGSLDVKQRVDGAYQKGYEVGQHEATTLEYQQGLDDAWEAARKICNEPEDGGLPAGAVVELFGRNGPILGCSAQNAINKIKAYEEQQKHDLIKVGDEVKDRTDDCGVVTWIYGNDTYVLWQDGSTGNYAADELIKTGRHFNFLASLLNAMKEGAE